MSPAPASVAVNYGVAVAQMSAVRSGPPSGRPCWHMRPRSEGARGGAALGLQALPGTHCSAGKEAQVPVPE